MCAMLNVRAAHKLQKLGSTTVVCSMQPNVAKEITHVAISKTHQEDQI